MAHHLLLAVAVSSFKLSHAAPLSLQDQYQAALQQVAELKGNGTFKDCCDVSKLAKTKLMMLNKYPLRIDTCTC